MATTVQTRPNHYMTLGLTPGASAAQIDEAYAREIILSRVRAFGATTQVSVAYETLRDPARRKTYDEAIGVRREPAPVRLPRAVSFRSSAHFISGPPPIEPKADRPPPQPVQPERIAASPPQPELPPEPRIAPFLAASLRNPEPPPPAPAPAPKREAELARFLQPRPSLRVLEAEADESGFNWRQPAIIVGALVGTVALVGAWAGVQAGNDVESSPAVTVAVPKAKAEPVVGAETAAEPAAPRRAPVFARFTPRPRPAARAAEPAEQAERSPVRQVPNGPFEEIAEAGSVEAAPALTEEAPAEAASASLPLSKASIARTIGRIGYPCGRVASTSQVLGKVFKVTCTSGDSYRAAPIHGRYRFKRL